MREIQGKSCTLQWSSLWGLVREGRCADLSKADRLIMDGPYYRFIVVDMIWNDEVSRLGIEVQIVEIA